MQNVNEKRGKYSKQSGQTYYPRCCPWGRCGSQSAYGLVRCPQSSAEKPAAEVDGKVRRQQRSTNTGGRVGGRAGTHAFNYRPLYSASFTRLHRSTFHDAPRGARSVINCLAQKQNRDTQRENFLRCRFI